MYGGHGGWSGGGNMMGMGMGGNMGRGMGLSGGMGGMQGGYGGRGNSFTGRGGGRGAPMGSSRSVTFTEGKLFLGGLDSTTTKESLTMYCSQWGEISDAVVMEGRGFGFVTFEDPKNAQNFLENRHHVIDGKSVEAKAAVPKGTGGSSNLTKKLFVGGTGELTDEDFRSYFGQFGEMQDAVIVRRSDGASRGFGFVTFADEMSVEKCLVLQHELNGKRVDLRRAVPKEQMATQGTFGVGMNMGGMRAGYGAMAGYGGGMGMNEMATMGPFMGGYSLGGMDAYQQDYTVRSRPQGPRTTNRFRPY